MVLDGPQYPLDDVIRLAQDGKVTFDRKAEREYRDMEMNREGAIELLCSLDESEYTGRADYSEFDKDWDVYEPKRNVPVGLRCLYVKLKIPSPRTVQCVHTRSMHVSDKYWK